MLILSLDTSSPTGSVAVLRDQTTIGVISTRGEENYSSRMFRHLEFLLNDLSLKLDHFDLFAVSAGPGSFTGLRVGLTAAKGWAEVYKKPVAGVSALEAVAIQSRVTTPVVVPVLDARRGQLYFGFYRRTDAGLALDGEEFVATPDEFAAQLREREREKAREKARDYTLTIVTPDAEVISVLAAHVEPGLAAIETASSVLAPFIGRIGHERALRGAVNDALTLDANYVRRTDAEMRWKDT
ncbi:MAG: tRNA (adenosine(37)-N6)-threonylcarbamoyltransferase complex dimerization subunit type 1 TsaB [Candidatus Acidiferrales bacterium]